MTLVWCDLKWTAFLTSHDTCASSPFCIHVVVSQSAFSLFCPPLPINFYSFFLLFVIFFNCFTRGHSVGIFSFEVLLCLWSFGLFFKINVICGFSLPIFRVLWLPWVKLLPSFHRVRVHNAHITLNHWFIFF